MPRALETFRSYLEFLPDELLESVTEDYVWLSGLNFRADRAAEFRRRREYCREECLRRGLSDVYRTAEMVASPLAEVPANPGHKKIALQFQIVSF